MSEFKKKEVYETIHISVTVNAKASVWMSFSFVKKTFHATNKFISNYPKRTWKEFGIEWSRLALEIRAPISGRWQNYF